MQSVPTGLVLCGVANKVPEMIKRIRWALSRSRRRQEACQAVVRNV